MKKMKKQGLLFYGMQILAAFIWIAKLIILVLLIILQIVVEIYYAISYIFRKKQKASSRYFWPT